MPIIITVYIIAILGTLKLRQTQYTRRWEAFRRDLALVARGQILSLPASGGLKKIRVKHV